MRSRAILVSVGVLASAAALAQGPEGQQTLTVPPNFRPGDYTIHIGFFSGSKRLEVSSGANDGENRARAGVLPVR